MPRDRLLPFLLFVFTGVMVGLAIVGGYQAYSPVPYWDMWNGVVGFFLRASDGDASAWWAQHNEHRIVLSRLLFWLDLRWFGGAGYLLALASYTLIAAAAFMFYRILRAAEATVAPTPGAISIGLFVTAWLFLWVQHENLTWAFQGHFVLAQLLPLCAFYWLHRSIAPHHSRVPFAIACGFGVASAGTLANGILALPLMAAYSMFTRQQLLRILTLLGLAVATIWIYFQHYQAPAQLGSFLQTLRADPAGVVHYVLLYLGAPFFFLLGGGRFAAFAAPAAGLMLIVGSAHLALRSIRRPRQASLTLAVLFFILYVGGTAVGTAGGRLLFGVGQALASRYTTPVLMAWAALLVLHAPRIGAALTRRDRRYLVPAAILCCLMIFVQVGALESRADVLFERKLAALALELHVRDQTQAQHLYPDAQYAFVVGETASSRNVSVFGLYPWRDAREQLGATATRDPRHTCQGHVDAVEAIRGDDGFVGVRGWIGPASAGAGAPTFIRLLDESSHIVGYAFSVLAGPANVPGAATELQRASFRGYLWTKQVGTDVILQGETPSCEAMVAVPAAAF